jgi:hypothetical protein
MDTGLAIELAPDVSPVTNSSICAVDPEEKHGE